MKQQTTFQFAFARPGFAIRLVLGAVVCVPAAAQNEVTNTTLPQVSVTADWLGPPTQASARKHPGARTVIGERQLTESGARSLEDALRQAPGLTVTDESGTGILPNIGVRGLNPLRSEQVLLLQDGIPMTLAPYGQTGASLFPLTLQSVQTIDVARGGVAVHYGPNNVGGVINFITRRIPRQASAAAHEMLTLSRGGRLLSDSYFRAGGPVGDSLAVQVQADAIAGQGERAHARTSVQNLMLDAEWFPSGSTDVRAGIQRYVTRNDLPGALTPRAYTQDRDQSTRPLDRFDGDTTRAHVTVAHDFRNGAELTWKNFGHRSTRVFQFGNATNADTVSTLRQTSPRDFVVWGTEPSVQFGIGGPVPQKIIVGARYMREEVDYKVDSTALLTGAYSVTRNWRFENDAYALYASDTLSFLDGRLKVTPGLRREDVRLVYRNKATAAQTRDATRDWLPGLDIGWQASGDLFVFANTHRSLRPVQFTQITFGGDLAAERARNHEAGVRWAVGKQVNLGLTAFRIDFDNKLEFVNATTGFRNLGGARHQGVELEAKWLPAAVRGLELGAGYTHVVTEQRSGAFAGKQLPYAPRNLLSLGSSYRTRDWSFDVNGRYQSSMFSDGANTEAENASGSVGRIPSYWLWNASVTRSFELSGRKMKAALTINNLFDRDYYFRGVDYSQGRMPQPGRAMMATVQVEM